MVMSCHGVSPLYIFTHAGCRGHLCILQSSPLESDPDLSNLDCSAKAINIILHRVQRGPQNIQSHYHATAYQFNPHRSIPRYQLDLTQHIGNECAFPMQMFARGVDMQRIIIWFIGRKSQLT